MPIIKLNGVSYPVSEEVVNYIDELIDTKHNLHRRLESIRRICNIWLKSDRNTIKNGLEVIGFNCIKNIAEIK